MGVQKKTEFDVKLRKKSEKNWETEWCMPKRSKQRTSI